MAAPKNTLVGYNVFFMGKSYAGRIEECNLPKIEAKTEEFRDATMAGPVKIRLGVNAIDTDFTVSDFSPQLLAAVSPFQSASLSLVFRGAYQDWDGKTHPRVITMRGQATSTDPGNAQPGTLAKLKLQMNLDYYSDVIDSAPVHEIDLINNVWMKNGVDVLSDIRDALGI